MSSREKIQVIVISVVLAAVLAIVVGRLFPSQTVAPPGPTGTKPDTTGDTDDAPIIMAGGSIFIATDSKASFDPVTDAGRKYLKYTSGYRVSRIELVDKKDDEEKVTAAQIKQAKRGSIEIDYCVIKKANQEDNDTCTANKTDTLTFTFDNDTTPPLIDLKNVHTKQVGRALKMSPTLWRFKIQDLMLFKVRAKLNGQQVAKANCGRHGECEILIHTCMNPDVTLCK